MAAVYRGIVQLGDLAHEGHCLTAGDYLDLAEQTLAERREQQRLADGLRILTRIKHGNRIPFFGADTSAQEPARTMRRRERRTKDPARP